jgi:hypothetical protein
MELSSCRRKNIYFENMLTLKYIRLVSTFSLINMRCILISKLKRIYYKKYKLCYCNSVKEQPYPELKELHAVVSIGT